MADKYLKQDGAGRLQEVESKAASAGAGDAGKIPALNSSGVLDSTIVNSKTTSAGAGDSGKVVALDSAGRIDDSMMPVGLGADTAIIVASETIAAGDFVNIHNDSGTAKVRKADATTAGKEAHGFVLAGGASAASITVYFEGPNTQVTGMTAGPVYLGTTAGAAVSAPPTGSGNVVQRIGIALSATVVNFEMSTPIVLA